MKDLFIATVVGPALMGAAVMNGSVEHYIQGWLMTFFIRWP